ncbi:MAG: hypothetical protein IKW96_10935 [Ruminococcus sp.]|uniref:hypothetical protein n=1 Tax=Ruminococcus sp. TaxID=41978 RepID=UPI0025FA7FE3|nr:hypothetical protein [Ruminococcus sp.]MBR5683765.1 hypothetical protein [Ruminococcus sp.]
MFVNGFIMQRYAESSYKGIDGSGLSEKTGENWFLNDDESFEKYYDENIDKTFTDHGEHSWVAACTDIEYISRYINEAKRRNIPFRILLCESEIPEPVFSAPDVRKKFLGYDYAYANGDNYSAVYNEIPFVFPQFTLNQYGLFQTKEEIDEYIAEREKFRLTHPPLTLEEGDFVVFKLYEVYL